jgi:hypothetical protein
VCIPYTTSIATIISTSNGDSVLVAPDDVHADPEGYVRVVVELARVLHRVIRMSHHTA